MKTTINKETVDSSDILFVVIYEDFLFDGEVHFKDYRRLTFNEDNTELDDELSSFLDNESFITIVSRCKKKMFYLNFENFGLENLKFGIFKIDKNFVDVIFEFQGEYFEGFMRFEMFKKLDNSFRKRLFELRKEKNANVVS